MTQSMDFQKLLEQSRQLNNHVAPPGLPQLERSIEQIDSRSKNLLKRQQRGADGGAGTPAAVDTRTAFLLANRGFDTDKVSNVLNQINLARAFEPLVGIRDTDIEGYLSNEHENIVSFAVEEGKRQTTLAYEEAFESALHRDWANAKRRIFEELGQHQSRHVPSVTSTLPSRDTGSLTGILNTSGGGYNPADSRGQSTMDPRLRQYASVVKQLNESRRQEREFDIIKAFANTAHSLSTNDPAQQTMLSCWGLLFQMLGGVPTDLDQPGRPSFRERQFFDAYHRPEVEEAKQFRQTMVDGARSWLEEVFSNHIVRSVRQQHGQIGGMPDIHAYVEEFLRLRFFRNGRWVPEWLELADDNTPFWAHVYVLVRTGNREDAFEYIRTHSAFLKQNHSTRSFDAYFWEWMNSPDGRLPRNTRDKLLADWNASIRDYPQQNSPSGDMFKYTLYKLIGRCELSQKGIKSSDVVGTAEDYLWLQLMLVQEGIYEGDAAHDQYTLRDMATFMMAHKHKYQNPVTWFTTLLACGEFEQAVTHLLGHDLFQTDAIHFAIAMAYLGILRVPDVPDTHGGLYVINIGQTQLQSGQQYVYHALNLAEPLQHIVNHLKETEASEVLHYIYLLGLLGPKASGAVSQNDNGSEQYAQLAQRMIRDVIASAKNRDALIGTVSADGTSIPGEIEKYRELVHLQSRDAFVEHIIVHAAEDAGRRGDWQLAVRLYHAAREFGTVVEILNKQLADRLGEPDFGAAGRSRAGDGDGNDNPVGMAEEVMKHYSDNPLMNSRVTDDARITCGILISFARFRELLLQENQQPQALDRFYATGLFPFSTDQPEITSKVEQFKTVNPHIQRVVPPIMVEAMEVLQKEYNKVSKQRVGYGDAGMREQKLAAIKDRGNALLQFAGALMHRIPGDALVKMNRSNTQMG